jgi:hypothetical protein
MVMHYEFCPCCDSKNITKVFEVKSFPAILFPIEKDKCFTVNAAPLIVFSCGSCDHLFLNDIDLNFNRSLYRDYYYLYPYGSLETMSLPYRMPFNNVLRLFIADDNINKKLLEIGCSNIEQLKQFKDLGFNCKGISPGAHEDYSDALIDGFYEDVELDGAYDVIVSRFNLEHIIDLKKFINKVYADLSENGLFIVQVPNAWSFLINGVINIFAHEHPNYFCKASLESLLKGNGFQIEYIKATEDDASIIAAVRKPKQGVLMVRQAAVNVKYVDDINNIINNYPNSDIYFYGAGLSLTGLLYLDDRILSHGSRIFVVDDNELLHGKCMPNTAIQIRAPIFPQNPPRSKLIFITLSAVYHEKIINKLKVSDFDDVFILNHEGIQRFIAT